MLILPAVLVLGVGLAACGGGKSHSAASSSAPSASASGSASAPAASSAAATPTVQTAQPTEAPASPSDGSVTTPDPSAIDPKAVENGDLSKDVNGNIGYQGQGRARLEKLFYQRSLSLLQYGGVLVFIVPGYVLDAELVGWLTRHYTDLRIYRAVETQFKQVVIFGRRVRQREQASDGVKAVRNLLLQVGQGEIEADELPSEWPFLPYIVPASPAEPEHFFRVTMEPEQFADEVGRLQGLWPSQDTHLGAAQQSLRPPARALSHWHLALALAAGAISGVVRSKTGRVLVVKGDTHKDKTLQRDFTEREDGSIAETRMTPGSPTRGDVLTIR